MKEIVLNERKNESLEQYLEDEKTVEFWQKFISKFRPKSTLEWFEELKQNCEQVAMLDSRYHFAQYEEDLSDIVVILNIIADSRAKSNFRMQKQVPWIEKNPKGNFNLILIKNEEYYKYEKGKINLFGVENY